MQYVCTLNGENEELIKNWKSYLYAVYLKNLKHDFRLQELYLNGEFSSSVKQCVSE